MSAEHAVGYDKGYAEAKARGDAAFAELEEKIRTLELQKAAGFFEYISELYFNEDGTTKFDVNTEKEKARNAALVKRLEYSMADAEALRGVGATLSIAESVMESLRLSRVRFRCYLCKYEHYEKVDGFVCPKCGKEAMGSQHFSGPIQSEIEEILARNKDEPEDASDE